MMTERVAATRNLDVVQQAYESLAALADWAQDIGTSGMDYVAATAYDILGMLFVSVSDDPPPDGFMRIARCDT